MIGESKPGSGEPAGLGASAPTRRHAAVDAEIVDDDAAAPSDARPAPSAHDPRSVTASATQRLSTVHTTGVAGEWSARDERAATTTIDLSAGMVLDNKYRIDRLIGRGGMGHVWRCTHIHMVGEVAVKILIDRLRRKQTAIERFWQEARMMGALGHPNIVRIFDVSPASALVPYMAMELLPLESLRARLKKGTLEPEEAIRLLDGVLSALIAAHKRGIIHRDIKPENLMFAQVRDINTDELRTELKVLDFGASILLDPESPSEAPEGIFGTPYYMSPEQAAGAPLDHRTDLYSAAVVLYEMLSGKLPHEGDGVHALVFNIATEPPIPLCDRVPDLPTGYYEFFDRALARAPEDRFQSAEAMRGALRDLSGALARVKRRTELYLTAIPDTPLPAPPKSGDTGPLAVWRAQRPVAGDAVEVDAAGDTGGESEPAGSTERLVRGGEVTSEVGETVQIRPRERTIAMPTLAPLDGRALALVFALASVVGSLSALALWRLRSAEVAVDWGEIGLAWLLPTLIVGALGLWWKSRGE